MGEYLRCVRRMRGTNDTECRLIAKEYLKCRMEKYVSAYLLYPDLRGVEDGHDQGRHVTGDWEAFRREIEILHLCLL